MLFVPYRLIECVINKSRPRCKFILPMMHLLNELKLERYLFWWGGGVPVLGRIG